MKFLKLSGIWHPLICQNELILATPHVSLSILAFTFFWFSAPYFIATPFPPYRIFPYAFFFSQFPFFLSSFCYSLSKQTLWRYRRKTHGTEQSCKANIQNVSQESVFGTLSWRAIQLRTLRSIPGRVRDFSPLHSLQRSNRAHPTYYSTWNWESFSGEWSSCVWNWPLAFIDCRN